MVNRRIVLLAAVVFTALYYSVAEKQPKQLDMAPDAVDYLYDKCRNEAMEKLINSAVLEQELHLNAGFQKAWRDSTQCPKLLPGGTKEHTAALWAYANGDAHFIKTLNDQVATMGGNISTYENNFSFKSLHFLLMDYMTLQKPQTCKTVYVLPDEKVKAQPGSKVKLGRFTNAFLSFDQLDEMIDLEDEVVLNISSCLFVNLGENICSKKTEVLLTPAELFTVEGSNIKGDSEKLYTEIVLKHAGLLSSPICDTFSRSPAVVATHVWLVLVLLSLSLFCIC